MPSVAFDTDAMQMKSGESTGKIKVDCRQIIDPPWTHMDPIRLGDVPSRLGEPAWYVIVELDGQPHIRVDVYPEFDGVDTFTDTRVWLHYVAIGWCDHFYLVDTDSREVHTFRLGDGYFGHMYPNDDFMLVASAKRVWRIDADGSVTWRSDEIAIDGVTINEVADGVITGQGEWDPPGGWKPFRLDLATGRRLEAPTERPLVKSLIVAAGLLCFVLVARLYDSRTLNARETGIIASLFVVVAVVASVWERYSGKAWTWGRRFIVHFVLVLILAGLTTAIWPHLNPPSPVDLDAEMAALAEKARTNLPPEKQGLLTYEPESVEQVEIILADLHRAHQANSLTVDELTKSSTRWGAYIGEVIRRTKGGSWSIDHELAGEGSFPMHFGEGESFPITWCYKRIVNGPEDNVWHKFRILILGQGAPDQS